MASQNNSCAPKNAPEQCENHGGRRFDFVVMIVLYILLVIILGACIW